MGSECKCLASVSQKTCTEWILTQFQKDAAEQSAQHDERHNDHDKVVIVVDSNGRQVEVHTPSDDWKINDFTVEGRRSNRSGGLGGGDGTSTPFKRASLAVGAVSLVGAAGISIATGEYEVLKVVAAVAVPAMLWALKR